MRIYLWLTVLIFTSGCIDTQKQERPVTVVETNITSEQNTTQTLKLPSQTAYLPFVDTPNQNDTVSLYATNGKSEQTFRLDQFRSENIQNLSYPILKNFTIFGDYIYCDYVLAKSTTTTRIKQLRTHIETNTVTESTEIEISENNAPKINRFIANDHLYVKTMSNNFYPYLFRYDTQGNVIQMNNQVDGALLTNVPMVALDTNIYMTAQGKTHSLVKLDTQEQTLSDIELPVEIEPLQLFGLQNRIYFIAYNQQTQTHQLWQYDTTAQNTEAEQLYTFTMPIGATFTTKAGEVFNDQLILAIPQKDGSTVIALDGTDNSMTTLFESINTIDTFIVATDRLYMTSSNATLNYLWESNGTVLGSQQLNDTQGNPLDVQNPTLINDRLYFSHTTAAYGRELWLYDGTLSRMLVDLYPGTFDGSPFYMTELNDGIVFQATADNMTNHLYYFDGNLTILE